MTARIEEQGNSYGHLTVICAAPQAPNPSKVRWICHCNCGHYLCSKKVIVLGTALRAGTSSCGASKKPYPEDLSNRTFGYLTVLHRTPRSDAPRAGTYWTCRCSCKRLNCLKRIVVRGADLRRGATRSCKKQGYSDRNLALYLRVISRYRIQARRRGFCWKLSDVFCIALFKAPCIYCGKVNSNKVSIKRFALRSIEYNGIDRINSQAGYTPNNVVSCCQQCNQSKSNLSLQEFYAWISCVYTHMKSTDANR